ncbi:YfbM family protein [Kitasatospora sp. DSM 101779]|uniref:YfbM family protein n=1 Tax=Kitasatospora sp. DSM 101779 TaxID=2853165 RepID=UPI0021D8E535|nr:YfbM family protein [Kitasatospora sp. DSM 101779]MCU7820478.1 YfbM family protein [Kitasatospora sp. DSM 101779]
MALTQLLARVSPADLDRCRRTAADSPDGNPGWDPPAGDRIDLNWALWGLLRHLRRVEAASDVVAVLDRSIDGDNAAAVVFLDHLEVYDRIGDPPTLLAPDAVAEVARELDTIDTAALLALLPRDPVQAAESCGFGRFHGALTAYLAHHVDTLRAFYRDAATRGLAVVTWVD